MRAWAFLLGTLLCAASHAQPSITGQSVPCENGLAAGHPCKDVSLLSRLMPDALGATFANDLWGWIDPDTGRSYALVGTDTSVSFVDITDPILPVYLGQLLSHDHSAARWRDLKVFQDHLFVVVDGAGANGLQVFDLTELRSPPSVPYQFTQSARYDEFGQAHNIAINTETGFAYVLGSQDGPCPGAIHMVDIQDPLQPAYAGCFLDTATGSSGDGYTHDAQCVIYRGPDADHSGKEVCIGANLNGISIADVTDKGQPVKIASADYPEATYAHQAWLTEDQRYLFLNDEADELTRHWNSLPPLPGTRTLIWDLEDLDDPILAAEYFGPTGASDHNLYVLGDTLYMANYAGGLRMADISMPTAPSEFAYFDTYAYSDHAGLHGAWTAYPYFGGGLIAISSGHHGLYLVRYDPGGSTAKEEPDLLPGALSLSPAYPNPFAASTTITVHQSAAGPVSIRARDLLGRVVGVLHEGTLSAGTHAVPFDASHLPGGPYLIEVAAGPVRRSLWVTRLK